MFFLTFFFLLTRILHLLFCPAELFGEELLRGTLAKELIEGLKIPFFDYAADHYNGGNLIYGLCTVPLFLLFGKSLFVLRLTGLLFQFGAFWIWYVFMKRFFGEKPALFTALLYLFSPPWLTLYSMYGMGNHAEPLFFTGLGLFFLYKILYEKNHSQRDAALLGLVSGFGAYFNYATSVSAVSFIFFWFYEDRRLFRKKEFFLFLLFLLIGFSPWVLYNSLYPLQGTHLLRETFIHPYGEKLFVLPFRFLKLATFKIITMLSFNYREGLDFNRAHITLFNILYYGAILFSYGLLYRFEKGNKRAHFFFLFPPLYLLAATLGRLDIDSYVPRYFMPLFPFFFAVIGLGLTHLGDLSKRFQKTSLLCLMLLLGMGVKGEWNLLSPKEFGLSLKRQGYSYRQLGWTLPFRHDKDFERLFTLGEAMEMRLPPTERFFFHHGLSDLFHFYPPQRAEDLHKYLPWIKRLDKTYQPFYLKEMGYNWGRSEGAFSQKMDVVGSLDPEIQPYLIEGLLTSFHFSPMKPERVFQDAFRKMKRLSPPSQKASAYSLGRLSWKRSLNDSFLYKMKHPELASHLRQELLSLYYRGLGALMANLYNPFRGEWPFPLLQTLEGIEDKWQEAMFWGAGFEAPMIDALEDPYDLKRMAETVPARFKKIFEKGIADRFAWGGRNLWIESEMLFSN